MCLNIPSNVYEDIDDQLVAGDDLIQVAEPDDELQANYEEPEYVENELVSLMYATAEANGDPILRDYLFRPTQDDAKLTFSGHKKRVWCVALNPEGTLAVSGGEDDKVFVWNVENGDVVHEITGHTSCIAAIEYNHDGSYLATGDKAGFIQVFQVSQEYKRIWSFKGQSLCWMKWNFASDVLMAGMESGDIYVWCVPQGDRKLLKGFGQKCEAATITNDGKRLAAGYGNGHFKIWDIETRSTILNSRPNGRTGHSANIRCVACDREGQLFITGSEDGKANIFNLQGYVSTLDPEDEDIDAVLIDGPDFEEKLAVTATITGIVSIWDAADQTLSHECEDQELIGITKLLWGTNRTIIGVTLDGFIKIWDVTSGYVKHELQGHLGFIKDVAYHKEKGIIVTGSQDTMCKVFQIPEM